MVVYMIAGWAALSLSLCLSHLVRRGLIPMLALLLDTLRYGLLLTVLNLTETYGTTTIVGPEGTLLLQVHLVETKEILHQQTL